MLLSPNDNCVVVARTLDAGASIDIDGISVTTGTAVPVGHKLARTDIAAGEIVRKYDAPIGHATTTIARGDHIHTHNLASDVFILGYKTIEPGLAMGPSCFRIGGG